MEHTFVADTADNWRLIKSGAPAVQGPYACSALDGWDDLEERELARGAEPGRPFLLRPDFKPDVDVLLYFASPRFRLLAPQSQLGYATNIRVFLSYLESQGVDWREATEDHVLNYEYRRRRKPIEGQAAISGAAFARELAALNHYFGWQKDRGVIQESPIKLRSYRRHDGTTGTTPRLRPKNVRSSDVKCLIPELYRDWRRVGLAGYTPDGLPDPSWRGRNDARNLAFADLLWTSGLRRKEAGTLLLPELPLPRQDGRLSRGRLGGAVAKGGPRNFRISQVGLRAIDAYRDSTRALAVLRAQAAGRYDHVRGRKIVRKLTVHQQARLEDEYGHITTESLHGLDADDRRRLFIEGTRGIEPAMLWLSESGMPIHHDSWKMVFEEANRRCEAQGVGIRCHPHMLRHSFALRWWAADVARIAQQQDDPSARRFEFIDPWVRVQHLLGHRSPETTRNIYLQPAREVEIDEMVNGDDGINTRDEVLAYIARRSRRVQTRAF